ncbi:hypothetical protein [Mesorhizobium sp. AA22]|uniref:hypothetical protein n=1 Tax=Mesorhizobium sp. AA22 TaxID=1854057 RepID=UPI0007ECD677|nr:hypothetical protein [Mesorhizobium sp. AA22]QIA22477.1 hypothetical protein A9K68_012335 [Mesorhizobium sp. AA22]
MLDSESEEIETIVRLLSDGSRTTIQARYSECETIIALHLEDGSEFLFALIKAAVEANVHRTNLIDDVISFLDDTHLARLAFFLQGEVKRGIDVEDLLAHVALQAPELLPASTLGDIPDFADWLTHDDPHSPPACHHFIFEEGAPSDMSFRRIATIPPGTCRRQDRHLQLAARGWPPVRLAATGWCIWSP